MQIVRGQACKTGTDVDHLCQECGCGFDLVEAAEYHMEWRTRLQSHIEGKALEAAFSEIVCEDNCCNVGGWLRGIGQRKFGHLASFRRLELEHSQFHSFAEMILARVQDKELLDAEHLLKNEFSQSTRRILVAIGELNEVVQQQATKSV